MVFKAMLEIWLGELGLSSYGIGVFIQSPNGDYLMQVENKLDFYIDKTMAKHLSLMDGLLVALELSVPRIQVVTDSDVVYDHVMYLGLCKINIRMHCENPSVGTLLKIFM